MNTIIDLRSKIHQYIDQADERLLRIINAIVESEKRAVSESQTLEEYNYDIILAEKDIEAGRVLTQEEVQKRSKEW